MFAASETWLHDGIDDKLIRLPNYKHFRCERLSRRGGGVCVWTHSSLNAWQLSALHQPDYLNAVWISLPRAKIILACIYLPPDVVSSKKRPIDDYIIFNSDLFLSKYCDFDVVICGDLNRYDIRLISSQIDLVNLVCEPTRSDAILDYFLVSSVRSCDYDVSVTAPIANSDHNTINAQPKISLGHKNAINKPLFDLRKSNIDIFATELASINWTPFYKSEADIDIKCDFFHETLLSLSSRCIPVTYVEIKESGKPWMTPLVKFAIQQRWDAYRRRDFNMFNHWKVKSKTLIESAKRNWSSKAKNDAKSLWKIVGSSIGTKSNDNIYALTGQYDTIETAVGKMNEFFTSVFGPDETLPLSQQGDGVSRPNWNIDIPVSMVRDRLEATKSHKAMGSDGIPTILYKSCAKIAFGAPDSHLQFINQRKTIPKSLETLSRLPDPKD